MKDFPDIITIRLTSKCNNNCKYCYAGPKSNKREMGYLKLKKLFGIFHERGVKAILLGGGEPLVRKDFGKIIRELRKQGIKIFLDTNGDFFSRHKSLILNYVDTIGLPIDFPDSSYRNKTNLQAILKALTFFKGQKKRPKIRIGTVVMQDNFNKLNQIGELIKDYPVDIWKLYEFIPQYGNSSKNKRSLEIPPDKFDKVTQEAKRRFSRYFKVLISKRKNRTNAYFFVDSNGVVFMPVDNPSFCGYVIIGDVFEMDIVEKWEKLVLKSNYKNNISATFNHNFISKT